MTLFDSKDRLYLRDLEYTGHNLVFIVGCPRSGTTWLQRLLASHPKVRTGQETDLFDYFIGPQLRAWQALFNDTSGRGGVGLPCYFTEEEFLQRLKVYLFVLLEPMIGSLGEGELFLEKTPQHALFLPEIAKLLPEAKIIHILRDPRDVVVSLLAAAKSWGKGWAPRHPYRAAKLWKSHVLAVQQAKPLIKRGNFYEIRYEALFAHPKEELQKVLKFLDLLWDTAELKRAVEENDYRKEKQRALPIKGAFAQRREPPLYEPAGFVRRAVPGSWKKDLTVLDKLWVYFVVRKIGMDLGYFGTRKARGA